MRKRGLLIILITSILVLVFGVLTCSAETSGSCGDNLTWSITGTGTDKVLSISGTGAMSDYGSTASPWDDEKANIKSVVIESGVTSIGSCAFDSFTNLESVEIPGSVTAIGNDAFNGCTGLTEVSIPGQITTIAEGTFRSCKSLTTVELPTSVGSIGDEAFDSCESMTSFTIPSGVTTIGRNAFSGCNSMTSITIPNSVTSVDDSAFTIGVLKYIFYGGTVAKWNSLKPAVGDAAVHYEATDHDYDYWLTLDVRPTATTPGSISRHCSCNGCDAKKDVVEIPATGYFQMGTMAGDLTWTLTGSQKNLLLTIYGTGHRNDSVEINTSTGFVTQKKNITSCEIVGDTIVDINGVAFSGFNNLSSISLPDSLTHIGERAFENCTSLTSITIPDNVTSINWGAFYGCTNLSSVALPGKMTDIPERLFHNCSKLKSVTLPNGITTIDQKAFCNCSSMESIVVPNKVTKIKDEAFSGCTSLADVTLSDKLESIYQSAFKNCTSLTKITIPGDVETIDAFAFNGCTKLAEVTVSDGVKDIHEYVFGNCTSLTSIAIPDSIVFVHEMAFSGSALKYLFYAGEKEEPPSIWDNLEGCQPGLIIHYNSTGHVYGDFVIDKAATCTETGSKSKRCTEDGCDAKTEVTEIAALGHNMTPHAAVAATCTEAGNSAYWSCDRCNKYFSDSDGNTEIVADSWVIEAKGHNMTEHPAVAATCTEEGNSAYWSCDRCSKYYSDKDGTGEIEEDGWVIAALDHAWDSEATVDSEATCTQDGSKSIHCSRCGDVKEGTTTVIPKTGHEPGAAVRERVVKPRCDADGSHDEVVYCTKCRTELSRNTITDKKKGHKWTSYVSKPATEFEVGFLTHRCTNCGSSYNTAIPQIVLPTDLPSIKISKPKAAKKRITIKWKKVNKKNQKLIDGIEMRITGPGYDSILTAGKKKSSKKVGGLQPKQVYTVQVRSYKYEGGVKHVSAWSGVKTAKVK